MKGIMLRLHQLAAQCSDEKAIRPSRTTSSFKLVQIAVNDDEKL